MSDGSIGKARLLIVDDEAAVMGALRDTLQVQGYDVVGCTAATAALTELQQRPFDLLLADLTMPEMNGIELLRAALQIDPLLVVVIMTGDGTIATAIAAMQSGAHDYILKPFNLSAIVPVLTRGLAVRQLRLENASLEQRLHKRAAELEAANRELEAYTRSVSHDLRTPLNGIIGFTELLNTQFAAQIPAAAQLMLGRVRDSALRMNQLIDDLLRLSKFGQQALHIENIDIESDVRILCEELNRQYSTRTISLRIDALPSVRADRALLRQAFANLLSNAYKFTRETPRAEIAVGSEMQNGERVFYVRDNGAGFDMASAQNLFGVFQRLHRSEDFEGTGVGLSIVQRIMQRHGGRVWAVSAPNQGATFYFTISAQADAPNGAAEKF
jgi:signal transduction histidine kinase